MEVVLVNTLQTALQVNQLLIHPPTDPLHPSPISQSANQSLIGNQRRRVGLRQSLTSDGDVAVAASGTEMCIVSWGCIGTCNTLPPAHNSSMASAQMETQCVSVPPPPPPPTSALPPTCRGACRRGNKRGRGGEERWGVLSGKSLPFFFVFVFFSLSFYLFISSFLYIRVSALNPLHFRLFCYSSVLSVSVFSCRQPLGLFIYRKVDRESLTCATTLVVMRVGRQNFDSNQIGQRLIFKGKEGLIVFSSFFFFFFFFFFFLSSSYDFNSVIMR